MVTTTISISSAREEATKIVTPETDSRPSNEHVPHDILHDKSSSETWLELSEVKDLKDARHSP